MTVEVYKHFFAKYNQKKFITRSTTIKKLKEKIKKSTKINWRDSKGKRRECSTNKIKIIAGLRKI